MKTLMFLIICMSQSACLPAQYMHGQQSLNNNAQRGMNDLIDSYERRQLDDDSYVRWTEPTWTFHSVINRQTSLEGLAKIQRQVGRRLGIRLSFTRIEFDSSGLSAISVAARCSGRLLPAVNSSALTDASDFGIYEIGYQNQRHWFIGSKASWPQQLHALVARQ